MKAVFKAAWFLCGWMIGMISLSVTMASVPKASQITDDTALYQRVSEIRVAKQPAPDFDRDIERLSKIQHRYQESFLLKAPMKRISAKKYRNSSRRIRTVRN